MSRFHTAEALLVGALRSGLAALPLPRARAAGAALGRAALGLGIRAKVARANLALALGERPESERESVLARSYGELGRAVAEYARFSELARDRSGAVFESLRGLEHLERGLAAGRGVLFLSAHYGNAELAAGLVAQHAPMALVTRRLSNPQVDRWIEAERRAAGFVTIAADGGVREIYRMLRSNGVVSMLGDQDARRHGVFVPFFGRLTSTPAGPARIALATRACFLPAFATRTADGRIVVEIEAPLAVSEPGAPDAVERLTALHVARLEARVRRHPEFWFWLHRRWKTPPPSTR